jgi:G3E family GTPase
VTVIDAFTTFNDFDTDDMLSSRRNDVLPEDERTVSDLMVDQIEFADVIVLNKTEMVGTLPTYCSFVTGTGCCALQCALLTIV